MSTKKAIVCPLDGRQFRTGAALQQHKRDAHARRRPTGPRSGAARNVAFRGPLSASRVGMQVNRSSLSPNVSSGTDLLASVSVRSGTVPGKLLLARPLGPFFQPRTRLHAESQLWGRWLPRRLRLRVVCGGSFSCFGAITVGWTPDCNYKQSASPGAELIKASALRPSATARLNEDVQLNIPGEASRKWYLVDSNNDDSAHGSIVVIISAMTGGYSGNVSVQIFLDWTIAFEGVEVSAYADYTPDVSPDPGWDMKVFTTSDGSWDSARLTLKEHSGGDMVPYSKANPGTIYRPSISNLAYIKEDGTTASVSYMVPIKGYKIPGMALFDTIQNARAYALNGTIENVLKYYSAGPFTTGPVKAIYVEDASEVRAVHSSAEVPDPVQLILTKLASIDARLSKLELGNMELVEQE